MHLIYHYVKINIARGPRMLHRIVNLRVEASFDLQLRGVSVRVQCARAWQSYDMPCLSISIYEVAFLLVVNLVHCPQWCRRARGRSNAVRLTASSRNRAHRGIWTEAGRQ